VSLNIIKTKDVVETHFKGIIYGGPGVGKTTLAGSMPKPLIVSAEAGLLSLKDADLDAVVVKTWPDVLEVVKEITAEGNPLGYESYAFDSLTEIQQLHLDHIKITSGKRIMSIDQWGENFDIMARLCRALAKLDANLMLIFLEMEHMAEGSPALIKRPALQGQKLPRKLIQYYDYMGYMFAQETKDDDDSTVTKRAIRFQPTPTIDAKDRSGKLDAIERPDFKLIHEKVFATKTPAKKSTKKEAAA